MHPYNAHFNLNLTIDNSHILPPLTGPSPIPTLPSFQQVVIQCMPSMSTNPTNGDHQYLYPHPPHLLHLKIEIVVRLIILQPNHE